MMHWQATMVVTSDITVRHVRARRIIDRVSELISYIRDDLYHSGRYRSRQNRQIYWHIEIIFGFGFSIHQILHRTLSACFPTFSKWGPPGYWLER